jgi:cytochrome c biogenesis protein CcmG, thiol:disulfide interchange protein DsbE
VALLLVLLVWKLVAEKSGANLVGDIAAGRKPDAPEFELGIVWRGDGIVPASLRRALADDKIALSELRGHPTVLNFWASWCVPCRDEGPDLAASARAHAGRVVFLGIDVQDFTSDARRFLRQLDIPYVSVRDGGDSTYTDYGLTGLPETYYLDREGRIVGHSVGAISRRELEEQISAALG